MSYRTFVTNCAMACLLPITVTFADQTDPALPGLFTSLESADSAATARQLESSIWEKWLEAPNADADRLLRKTTSALSENDLREALLVSTELVEQYPEYAEGWNKRATIYYLMGNFDESVADIKMTLSLEPRHFGAISGLGLIFRYRGELKPALAAFEQVLKISPQSYQAQRGVEELRNSIGREI